MQISKYSAFPISPYHREGDKLVPSVQKKINELEVGLLHLQQNIDIPEISLTIHNTIATAVKRATEAGNKQTVEDLGPLISDSSFLNALQKDVSRWIREIQKVCTCTYIACVQSVYYRVKPSVKGNS